MAIVFIMGIALQSIVGAGGGGGGSSGSGALVGDQVSLLPATHILREENFGDYNSTPPTSGPHWDQRNPDAPVRCGIYDEQLLDEQIVHNLEHGNVVISHNLTDPGQLDELETVAKGLPGRNRWLVMRSYLGLNVGQVAIAAWGWLQTFDGVDPEGLEEFYNAHFNSHGPESVVCS